MTKFDKRWLANFKEFQLFLNKNHRIPEMNEVTTSEGTDLRSWFMRQQSLGKNNKLPEYRNNFITELLSYDLWYKQKITYINSILFLCYTEKLYPSKAYFKEDTLKTSIDIEIYHLNLSSRLENILHRSGFFKLSELEF